MNKITSGNYTNYIARNMSEEIYLKLLEWASSTYDLKQRREKFCELMKREILDFRHWESLPMIARANRVWNMFGLEEKYREVAFLGNLRGAVIPYSRDLIKRQALVDYCIGRGIFPYDQRRFRQQFYQSQYRSHKLDEDCRRAGKAKAWVIPRILKNVSVSLYERVKNRLLGASLPNVDGPTPGSITRRRDTGTTSMQPNGRRLDGFPLPPILPFHSSREVDHVDEYGTVWHRGNDEDRGT